MNKICVYAICKNEEKFVDKWLDNMSEADYIVVLDTGSTDKTFEKLKNDPRVTKVVQKIYSKEEWRFDVARNDSLELVPEDANILIEKSSQDGFLYLKSTKFVFSVFHKFKCIFWWHI